MQKNHYFTNVDSLSEFVKVAKQETERLVILSNINTPLKQEQNSIQEFMDQSTEEKIKFTASGYQGDVYLDSFGKLNIPNNIQAPIKTMVQVHNSINIQNELNDRYRSTNIEILQNFDRELHDHEYGVMNIVFGGPGTGIITPSGPIFTSEAALTYIPPNVSHIPFTPEDEQSNRVTLAVYNSHKKDNQPQCT